MKRLSVEEPNKEAVEYPWTATVRQAWNIDLGDKVKLENGEVVWVGETAFSLIEETE